MVDKRAQWLEKHGFTPDGFTYIIVGETYPIKDKLFAEGWRYDPTFKWHKADPTGYEDCVVKIDVNEVIDFSLWFDRWGEVAYYEEGINKIERLVNTKKAGTETFWLEGDRVKKIPAVLTNKNSYFGKFGLSYIYTFKTDDNAILVWFTTKMLNIAEGNRFLVSGNIKDRKEFKGTKQTIVTRCQITKIENEEED